MLKLILRLQPAVFLAVAFACRAGEQPGPARMLARLPAVVQKTIRAQVGAGRLTAIEKNTGNEETTYDVEMVRDGKDRLFTVAGDGALLDVEVFLGELPAIVQKAIQAQAGKGALAGIYRSTDSGETTYDVDLTRDGKTRSVTIGADGDLLDEEVFLAELPAAVQKTIQAETSGGTLDEINKSVEDGQATYDVEFTRGGKSRGITVGAKGELLDTEVFLAELPDVLQKAIQARLGNSKPAAIRKCTDDGDVTYDVEITQGSKARTLTFDPDGTLSSEEEDVDLLQTPEAVRKEIQTLIAKGKLGGISKITEDKDISYDVDIKQSGEWKSFSIAANGALLEPAGGK